jgi:hypothetical protein
MNEETTPKRLTLEIYRPWWFRGNGPDDSKLLLDDPNLSCPMMCCLGQLSIKCGIDTADIAGVAEPHEMEMVKWKSLPERVNPVESRITDGGYKENDRVREIIATNDAIMPSEEDREALLISKFGALGIDVKFTDELPDYLSAAFPQSTNTETK